MNVKVGDYVVICGQDFYVETEPDEFGDCFISDRDGEEYYCNVDDFDHHDPKG